MMALTGRQKEILEFFTDSVSASGRAPTIREIAGHFGISIGPVQRHLKALGKKGYLTRTPLIARGLDVASRKPQASVPVLGRVTAGLPADPVENAEGHVHVDRDILKGGKHFALRVKGDSMNGAGILEGDIVVVRQQAVAEQNDIVVALADGEATVKKLKKRGGEVYLEAANPAYKPIRGKDIEVLGKVVYLARSF